MATLAHTLRTIIEYALLPFDVLPAFWGLTLFSIITGVIMLWVVGKLTPQRRIEQARDRVASAIYETRLFLDSPSQIIKSQGRMLGWLMAYLAYLMPAFFVLSIPLGLLYFPLEARHGIDAIPVDSAQPIVVRVDLADGADGSQLTAEINDGAAVTAPPLYDRANNRAYLRLEITEPRVHTLTLRMGGAGDENAIAKALYAESEPTKVSPDRTSGWDAWLAYGHEPPLDPERGIAAITVPHPPKPQSWLGMAMPWWLYWLIVSTVFALALRRPMGVVL